MEWLTIYNSISPVQMTRTTSLLQPSYSTCAIGKKKGRAETLPSALHDLLTISSAYEQPQCRSDRN